MSKKEDMKLEIGVTISGTIDPTTPFKPTVAYQQGASVPNSPNVVDGQGNVDLPDMNPQNQNNYTQDTDITFDLSGQIFDPNGNSVAFSFPSTLSEAVTVTMNGQPAPNIGPKAGKTLMQVILDDNDGSGATYTYCLAIQMAWPAPNGTLVQLDPSIVNR